MDYNALAENLRWLIFYIGQGITYCLIFKEEFKYRLPTVALIYTLIYTFSVIGNISGLWTIPILYALKEIVLFCYQIPLYREKIINCYILEYMRITIANLLGNGILVVVLGLFSLLFPEKGFWLSDATASPVTSLLLVVGIIPGFALSLVICRKIKAIVLEFRGIWKWFLFFGTVGTEAATIVVSYQGDQHYAENPGGIPFLLEIIVLLVGMAGIISACILYQRNRKRENQDIEARIAEDYRAFRKVLMLRQTVRELNHELRNYCISGTPAVKARIENYCDMALASLEEQTDANH